MSICIFPQDTISYYSSSAGFLKRQKRICHGPVCSDFKNNFFVTSFSMVRISFPGNAGVWVYNEN